jgi:hypothetical protein
MIASFLLRSHSFSYNLVNFSRESGSTGGESQAKTLKSLIRNIGSGLPTSPILGRKISHQSSSGNAKNVAVCQQVVYLDWYYM